MLLYLKRLNRFIILFLLLSTAKAQPPQRFSYQAVLRNASNALLSNQAIGMRISILQASASGTASYVETHTTTTNAQGLINLEIGGGTVVSGSLSGINWLTGAYFVKTETDPAGGTNYSLFSTSRLQSVPYAMHASTAGNGVANGTANNQIMYWNGSSWIALNPGVNGQVLTMCNGVLTWTNGGQCQGALSALNCSNATQTGTLSQGITASGVSVSVPYTDGNGGVHGGQSIASTGVTGLTASLSAGNFVIGAGNLIYTITGNPSSSGSASFALSIGGKNCTLTLIVNTAGSPGSNASASCGAVNVHNATLTYGNMTDQNGNTYKTIKIGSQEWMAENLKVSHYRNGDPIPIVTNLTNWAGLATGAACWYSNDSAQYNCPYGKLYNWYAVSDSRNLCPSGWRVPADADFVTLQNFLGNDAGGKMKTQGITYWSSGNTGGINTSGFSALPGGYQRQIGDFSTIGVLAHFWTSTGDIGQTDAVLYRLSFALTQMEKFVWDNRFGFSVRCLKN